MSPLKAFLRTTSQAAAAAATATATAAVIRRPSCSPSSSPLRHRRRSFFVLALVLPLLLVVPPHRPVQAFAVLPISSAAAASVSSSSSSSSSAFPCTGAATASATTKATTCKMAADPTAAGAAGTAETTNNAAGTTKDAANGDEDPHMWLEDVESERSLDFAREANAACLEALGDPSKKKKQEEKEKSEDESPKTTYDKILEVLESDDRIPHVTSHGTDPETGERVLFNFWKDSKNPKGVWRRTTLESYKSSDKKTEWDVMLDVDELGKQDGVSWVWKGSRALPRARDPANGKVVTRSLLSLSRGGSDAVHVREFDLIDREFVEDRPFNLPEAKSRASYKSRDVLYVATDFGPDSLTDSGYPRTVREWVRGTPLEDAPIVFEGDKKDVSVFTYATDERLWGGGIYEVRGRSLDFYTSKYWVRKVEYGHLLAPDDPARAGIPDPPEFVEVDIQPDASLDFLGNMVLISLRSDWEPVVGVGKVYKKGSLLYTAADNFFENGSAESKYTVLFEPTERTAYEYYTITRNYFVLYTMDNVKSKLDFYRISDDGTSLTPVEGGFEPQIHDYSVRPVDPYEGSDMFWFTSNGFETPSTLYLADAGKVEDAAGETAKIDETAFVTEKIKSLPHQYDSSNVAVEQRVAVSEDGTNIPYFIVMDRSTKMDGSNPTLLYGYGGFEVSLGPHYVATQGVAWLERGGVYVEANIRGGGEFGPAWHQAGLKADRNKCYEDFVAVAEHLIETGVCTNRSLAIRGGSNGGLLMGNMYTMRPDLFGAIHCAVPLLDMKRYHKLLAGASWMAEYGDPDTDDWEFLQKYSPYHNIDPEADYPPILVTTSTRDDRVHPGHARKFVKKLWDDGKGRWPVYYYENIEGGHGGAADAKQQAFMNALAYDFMMSTLRKNIDEMKK